MTNKAVFSHAQQFLALVLCCFALTAPAFSQQSSQRGEASGQVLEEIVVTARHGEELLSDTPIAIAAYSAENIDRLDINNIDDLARFTPGLTVSKGVQPNSTKLSMRGLDVARGRSPVAIRIDGVDVTTESVYSTGIGYLGNQRLMDIERIEVVKGAQVALYGRAAFGGAINYVTKRPSLDALQGSVRLDANGESEQDVRLSLNGPVIPGKLGLGLNANYWNDDGTYTNLLSGDELGQGDGIGVAGSLYAAPSDRLSVYARVEFAQDDVGMAPAIQLEPNTTVTFTDPDVITAVNGSTGNFFSGTVPKVNPADLAISLTPAGRGDYPGIDKESAVGSLIVDYEFEKFTLSSLTGYLDHDTKNYQNNIYQPTPFIDNGVPNPNGGVVPAFYTGQEFEARTFSRIFNQEIRLRSSDDGRLRWQVGGLYWKETIDQQQAQLTLLPIVPVTTQDFIDFFNNNEGNRKFERHTTHSSVYAWAEYDISDTLAISAEVRSSSEDIEYQAWNTVNVSLAFPGPTIVRVSRTDLNPTLQPRVEISESFTTPKLALRYTPTDELTLYASAAKSVKPSGHATGGTEIFNEFTLFDQEEMWSYEIGAKARFLDGRASTNAAFFLQDYTNQQVNTVVFDTGSNLPRGATANAGDSERWGFELDGVILLTENLTLSGSYTYLNTEFTTFEVPTSSVVTAAQAPGGCARLDVFPNGQPACIVDYSGNEAGKVPDHSLVVSGRYEAQLTQNFDWFAEGNINYVDDRFLTFANNVTAPSYTLVDFRAGISSERLQAILYVNNVFDEEQPTDIESYLSYNPSGFPPAPLVFLPDQRTIGVRLRYDF